MSKRFAFWFFLVGTFSSTLLFLILTVDTHKQVKALTHVENLTDDVVAGKKVWEKYNCNDCHTILGFGGYYAPDMTKVYKRLGAVGIEFRVKNPQVAFASSWRKMPQQNVSEKEITVLIAFLKWISEIDNNDWPPQDSEKQISRSALRLSAGVGMPLGAALLKEKGCIVCHTVKDVGGDTGVPLDDAGRKYNAETLERLIRNPKSVNPGAAMPPQDQITEEEIDAIAEFLVTLKH
jgi:nitric oxide reductase subunit C